MSSLYSEHFISIVLPVYNGEKNLREAIQSILDQSYKYFELIVINDGSTDDSLRIIESFDDPRIRVFTKLNSGLVDSLNMGISLSHGNWIARMDADDICSKDRLEEQIKYIDYDIAVIGTQVYFIDSQGNVVKESAFPASHDDIVKSMLKLENCIAHPSTLINKSFLLSVGSYNPFMEVAEDYDLWLKLSKLGKIINVNKKLLFLRKHEGNVSLNKIGVSLQNVLVARAIYMTNQNSFESKKEYDQFAYRVKGDTKAFLNRCIRIENIKNQLIGKMFLGKLVFFMLRPWLVVSMLLYHLHKHYYLKLDPKRYVEY